MSDAFIEALLWGVVLFGGITFLERLVSKKRHVRHVLEELGADSKGHRMLRLTSSAVSRSANGETLIPGYGVLIVSWDEVEQARKDRTGWIASQVSESPEDPVMFRVDSTWQVP